MRLIGRYGEIKVNDNEGVAVIHHKLLEQKYGSVCHFPIEDLSKWIKRLKIESNEEGTIRFNDWP